MGEVTISLIVYMFSCCAGVGLIVGIIQQKKGWDWLPYFAGVVTLVALVYPIRLVTGITEYEFTLFQVMTMGLTYMFMIRMGRGIVKAHFKKNWSSGYRLGSLQPFGGTRQRDHLNLYQTI